MISGTTQVFVLFGMGTWTGRALDAGFFRIQFILGSIISVTGLFLLSLCKTFWQIFLCQTLCVGFGFGLSFVPTLALLSTYFDKNRSTAIAVAVTGSCIGGVVFPAISEKMFPSAGFAWAVRTIAFVQLACVVAAGLVLKVSLCTSSEEHIITNDFHSLDYHHESPGRSWSGRHSQKLHTRCTCSGHFSTSGQSTSAGSSLGLSPGMLWGPVKPRASISCWS